MLVRVTYTPDISLREMRHNLALHGPELYIGTNGRALVWAGPQQALLVLGPPRSGKTSTLVIPNVLAAPGPVVVTSTKLDVLQATVASRQELGHCWLLDPAGASGTTAGATLLQWSPVHSAASWEEALVTARVMTAAAKPRSYYGEGAHWAERAEALLAPLLHAAALAGTGMRQVLSWVLRHDLQGPAAVLSRAASTGAPTGIALDVLAGIDATEEREQSGIFSTAAGTLAAYRSERALELAESPNFDTTSFPASTDTVYVCAPARYQQLVAPIVVAFLEQLRAATYKAAEQARLPVPVTFVLDEVANVAPLPDLPATVSEAGGQGLLVLACLQDLSQARIRWGRAAEGFFSLFGAKVLLPGVGDLATLEAISRLAGQTEVVLRSVSSSGWWSRNPSSHTTYSSRRQARLPVDRVHSLPDGTALLVAGAQPPQLIGLTRWWDYPPFCEASKTALVARPVPHKLAPSPAGTGPPLSPLLPPHRLAQPPPPPPASQATPRPTAPTAPAGSADGVVWRRLPGQRRLHPPPPRL
ncbi:MAG: type IV secretory system conjugative DNA transfer family protein [Acidimicrobiales bacterium]